MSPSSSCDSGDVDSQASDSGPRGTPFTVDELDSGMTDLVNTQMVTEVFRLAGRNSKDHEKCFEACVQMVDDTDVILAISFRAWEKHPAIQVTLDALEEVNPTEGPSVWMPKAPVAVAAVAALNAPQIRLENGSRLMDHFNDNSLWDWVGAAIDFWSATSSIIHIFSHGGVANFVHTSPNDNLFQKRGSLLQPITLSLFIKRCIKDMGGPAKGGVWIWEKRTPAVLTYRREDVMKKGRRVLAKLGDDRYDQSVLDTPINSWLWSTSVRVLPADVKDKLLLWSFRYDNILNNELIKAREDLTEYHCVYQGAILAAQLKSEHLFKGLLDQGRCFASIIKDTVSRNVLEVIISKMQESNRTAHGHHDGLPKVVDARKALITRLTEYPQPLQVCPQNFAGLASVFDDETSRLNSISIFQQIFDASTCGTPECRALISAWLILLPQIDVTILPSLCFDIDKAKHRWALSNSTYGTSKLNKSKFSEMATSVSKIDPESPLMAYLVFRIYMPEILSHGDVALVERCLGAPKTVLGKRKAGELGN
ncbi:hypothetical protein NM208_g13326 [Fusarium decemcellulare]|uniref:Uncharacterized protein n=1 Tax=Fusarium decemcellulare TaxID=57161 RepID=A0ACC1RKA1_9HYPO|nr:hypothetical protein NM208_g13326 [Fusarium decemcellulare]